MKQLRLSLSEKAFAQLTTLKDEIAAKDYTSVVVAAVGAYRWLWKLQADGDRLIVESSVTGDRRCVEMLPLKE